MMRLLIHAVIHRLHALVLRACRIALALCSSTAAFAGSVNIADEAYPTTLGWTDGAPTLYRFLPEDQHLHGFSIDRTPLSWRSPSREIVLKPRDAVFEFSSPTEAGIVGHLEFRLVHRDGARSRLRLRLPPEDDHKAPIRIIESGTWFHHVALYGLEVIPEDGASRKPDPVLSGPVHIEWRAWPDRGSIEIVCESFGDPDSLRLEAGWKPISSDASREPVAVPISRSSEDTRRVHYSLSALGSVQWLDREPAPESDVTVTAPGAHVAFDPRVAAWVVEIPQTPWPAASGMTYPPDQLARRTETAVEIVNRGKVPAKVQLRFHHPEYPHTGFVPMLLDGDGGQTGWPLQASKNWHVRKGRPRLPYDGEWVRTSVVLEADPQSTSSLRHVVVHATWNDVPVASGHQLSLVGWGSNGFWQQLALGAWGEQFCFQPGRVLRRAFITDIRPLFQGGMDDLMPYSWTSNVGGGDVGVILDPDGHYVPWRDACTVHYAAGPGWFEAAVDESLVGGAASLRTTVMMPRGDDFLRVFLKCELEVTARLPFSRFALLEIGTDYYASARGAAVTWGPGAELGEQPTLVRELSEAEPPKRRSVPWEGPQPWAFLRSAPEPANAGLGFGHRGLILRSLSGQVGARPLTHLWLASRTVRDRAPNLNAEITVSPETDSFVAGDRIHALFEIVILPGAAEAYIGPNEAWSRYFKSLDDIGRVISAEASGNNLTVSLRDGRAIRGALPSLTAAEARNGFSVTGGQGHFTLRITGLHVREGWTLFEQLGENLVPVGTLFPQERQPQWTWDPRTQDWSLYVSLTAPWGRPGPQRTFLLSSTSH